METVGMSGVQDYDPSFPMQLNSLGKLQKTHSKENQKQSQQTED